MSKEDVDKAKEKFTKAVVNMNDNLGQLLGKSPDDPELLAFVSSLLITVTCQTDYIMEQALHENGM